MSGRKLIGSPVMLQDWDDEAEEGGAKYWELFLDLLMVAAASAVADGLKEDPTLRGLNNFVIVYFLFVNGWMLYTHLTTRFEDGTFLHSMFLFVFILGNAICIVNASLESSASALAFGALLQRIAILLMLFSIHLCIPRARVFCKKLGTVTLLEAIVLTLATCVGHDQQALTYFLFSAAICIELSSEFFLSYTMKREELVPLNIEHFKDRLGILLLVMLGETVISTTIEDRRLAGAEEIQEYREYYWVLFWALVLVFFYTLLYFAMSPPPAFHALRRSRLHGSTLMLFHKCMCGSVLAVGAAVKLTIEAVIGEEELSDFAVVLWSVSVGCSLLFLFGMRLLHYSGVVPSGSEPPHAIRLMYIWWGVFALSTLLPFLGLIFKIRDPVTSIATYAGFLFVLCFVESSFTHVLGPYLEQGAIEETEEAAPLKSSSVPSSYQSTGAGNRIISEY
jgi:low temperature requirement protein LtrA